MKLTQITEQVVDYPTTGDYDINVWADNGWANDDRFVSLSFYPLWMTPQGYLETDTSTYHTLTLSLFPRGPKQREALAYIRDLVNTDGVFDAIETDWWSNECALADAPELIQEFMAELPRDRK